MLYVTEGGEGVLLAPKTGSGDANSSSGELRLDVDEVRRAFLRKAETRELVGTTVAWALLLEAEAAAAADEGIARWRIGEARRVGDESLGGSSSSLEQHRNG